MSTNAPCFAIESVDRELKPVEQAEIPFEFGLDTDDGFPHRGVLDFADNRIDPTTGTIEVRGKAGNPDGRFIPGGRVRVRVAVSEPYPGIVVPDTAILTDQDKKYVLYLNDENVVLRRDIKPGRLLDDGMRVILPDGDEATAQLRKEDRVIVLGLQRARLNYPVEPLDESGNLVARVE
jgi:multidrug efflux system membrane fusion protein